MLQSEYAFTLPCGFIDQDGNLHRTGIMRRATALDEIEPLQDARVKGNSAYLGILLLARVVVQLGTIRPVPLQIIERLFAPDFIYLQNLYLRINDPTERTVETRCPRCGANIELDLLEAMNTDKAEAYGISDNE